ncbi:MAG: hypothetical protein QM790_16145 [Nibricoccus sp.]
MANVPQTRTIYVDLDGTLIWTWSPMITTKFMSMVFNEPIETPPTVKDGYRRLKKVPIGKQYALASCRPNIQRFLATLRRIGDVRMITHAERDYARAMNRVFKLGFSESNIVVALGGPLPTPESCAVLLDDESGSPASNYEAQRRHAEKCRLLGILAGSSKDIPVPAFAGLRNDPFCRPRYWRRLVRKLSRAIANTSTMPPPPKEDPTPPYVLDDFYAGDPQARLELICGPCLSTRETARLLGVCPNTVLRRYNRDELISFPALFGKNRRRFPRWQFSENDHSACQFSWVKPIIAAFGQNGWGLVEFLVSQRLGPNNLTKLCRADAAETKKLFEAARLIKANRERRSDGEVRKQDT